METYLHRPPLRRGLLGFALAVVLLTASPGCQLRTIHVVVPDFASSLVQGIDVYRVDEATGQPLYAGQLSFGQIVVQPDGSETVAYALTESDGTTTSGLQTTMLRSQGGNTVELHLIFSGATPSGDFRVATYNAAGTSPLSPGSVYLL
jgi:hypothetical protein